MKPEAWELLGIILGGVVILSCLARWLQGHLDREHEKERLHRQEAAAVRERREDERSAISDARWRKLWIIDDPERNK